MRINHVALYCLDLEEMRGFFIRYFNGTSNELYHNPRIGLKTFILSFDGSDAHLELMTRPEVRAKRRISSAKALSTCPFPSAPKKKWTDLLTNCFATAIVC